MCACPHSVPPPPLSPHRSCQQNDPFLRMYIPPLVAIVGALVSTSLLPRPFPQSQTKRKTAAYLGYGKGGGERGGSCKAGRPQQFVALTAQTVDGLFFDRGAFANRFVIFPLSLSFICAKTGRPYREEGDSEHEKSFSPPFQFMVGRGGRVLFSPLFPSPASFHSIPGRPSSSSSYPRRFPLLTFRCVLSSSSTPFPRSSSSALSPCPDFPSFQETHGGRWHRKCEA